jgi:hypothetical protein
MGFSTTTQRIKWSYASGALRDRPAFWSEADARFRLDAGPPLMGQVLLARVAQLGHHKAIDDPAGARHAIFEGDVVGVVFSPRYATEQFEAIVPPNLETVQIVAGGGVCGLVVSRSAVMQNPTMLQPLGFLVDRRGNRINLSDHGLSPTATPNGHVPVVLSVGASMDAGKTTAAGSLVHGLSRAGWRVSAAKLTGTAAAKDPRYMLDSGAMRVLDFAGVGYASTLGISAEQLENIADTCMSQLAEDAPDLLVLEIADGITQRETRMLLSWFAKRAGPTYAMYSCGDALAVDVGIRRLRALGVRPIAVSGTVTISPLAMAEAQAETDLPVLSREMLRNPEVVSRLGLARAARPEPAEVVVVPRSAEHVDLESDVA